LVIWFLGPRYVASASDELGGGELFYISAGVHLVALPRSGVVDPVVRDPQPLFRAVLIWTNLDR